MFGEKKIQVSNSGIHTLVLVSEICVPGPNSEQSIPAQDSTGPSGKTRAAPSPKGAHGTETSVLTWGSHPAPMKSVLFSSKGLQMRLSDSEWGRSQVTLF